MKKYFNVENLCFGYLKKPLCLKDVNFSAEKNERVLVLGIEESAKTSFLKTISGFDEHYFGSVKFEEKEIRKISDENKCFSLIFDEPILLNSSIDKNINYIFEVLKREKPSDQEKQKLLETFKINHGLKANVCKLSLFEKFKLCFMRIYIKQSKVVFIDDILKYDFSSDDINELKDIVKLCLYDRLIFWAASNKTIVKYKDFFDEFLATKIIYLSSAKAFEYDSFEKFLADAVDLDSCSFNRKLKTMEGYCVYQESTFYLKFENEYVIKIDKSLNDCFEKLKLGDGENEDIVMVYHDGLSFDLAKNNDINKLFKDKKLMIFSKLDRSRVL